MYETSSGATFDREEYAVMHQLFCDLLVALQEGELTFHQAQQVVAELIKRVPDVF